MNYCTKSLLDNTLTQAMNGCTWFHSSSVALVVGVNRWSREGDTPFWSMFSLGDQAVRHLIWPLLLRHHMPSSGQCCSKEDHMAAFTLPVSAFPQKQDFTKR